MIGQTIAHYSVTAKLGQGGMGAVYRATDTKLDREVAIKVLPEFFTQDEERLTRFEREAKALAALNHPNIAGIYGLEQSGDSKALILELVEGEDLSERLKRGPLPVEESLEVCKQIAEALEAAHEKGIIHRDLKPGNIKLLPDGRVKVLDFGLAKVIGDTPSPTHGSTALEDSPTVFTHGQATMPGVLLGTAGYMSPEQARGKPVDKRSDIWSFGVVLLECLTGKRLFPGESVTDSVGALLHQEIDWSQLPSDTPPTIQLLLRKCLARDRKRRLPDIGAARLDLEQAISDPSSSVIRLGEGALRETKEKRGISLFVMAGLILATIFATVGLTAFLKPKAPSPPIRRLKMELGEKLSLVVDRGVCVRFSPDGSTLAYMAREEGGADKQLYLLRQDQLGSNPLAGTEGVNDFGFDPEGKNIVFNSGGLTVMPVANGTPTKLGRIHRIRGLHWGTDGFIYIGSRNGGLRRVSSAPGGKEETLTQVKEGEVSHRQPLLLPDARALLFTAFKSSGIFDDSDIMILRLPGGKPELLLSGSYSPRFVPTGKQSGHLLYMRQGTLFAVGFDLDSLKTSGRPTQVVPEVMPDTEQNAVGHFDVSPDGTLVYVKGTLAERLYELEWVDREGEREPFPGLKPADYGSFRLSPDGKFLAYDVNNGKQSIIATYDIERDVPGSRLTIGSANESSPVWSPGGGSIAFASQHGVEAAAVYLKRTDAGGEAQRLLPSQSYQLPWSWHSNHLAILDTSRGFSNVRILDLQGNDNIGWSISSTNDFPTTPFGEWTCSFSADGRWLAYASDELGVNQVYVRAFPGGDGKKQVSRFGGAWPVWSSTTNELLFEAPLAGSSKAQVLTVSYSVKGNSLIPAPPRPWTGGTFVQRRFTKSFDLDQRRQRLLVRKSAGDEPEPTFHHVVVVENFYTELSQKVPLGTD